MTARESRLEDLMAQSDHMAATVRAILNILLEAPYFYKEDDERLFLALSQYRRAFDAFFRRFYGWELVVDARCARLYKPRWYNERITPANRDMFDFTRRDDCIAFLLLLEFFERELQEQDASPDDPEPLRFRYGSLLEYECRRFRELLPDKAEKYPDEAVRRILRGILPTLRRYRFLRPVQPPADEAVRDEDTLYECLPALWHYQPERLAQTLSAPSPDTAGAPADEDPEP